MGNLFSRQTRQSSRQSQYEANSPTPEPAVGVPVAQGVPALSPPLPPLPATDALSLKASVEKSAVTHKSVEKLVTMLSLKAPAAIEDAKSVRAPLDIVACIDRSGSMGGPKMTLMKKTLDLLITRAGLNEHDRLALVTFDTNVRVDMPLAAMDSNGRSKGKAVVNALRPGSTTNLSGGALKSIDILAQAPNTKGRTRAVLLFTDGLANCGISDSSKLVEAVTNALRAAASGGDVSLFTFGFGADHNENVLREVAASHGSGGYYYVGTPEDIPNAFADCLGGLTSVVAQNASLSLEPLGGATITRVLGTYSRSEDGSVELGDLYSEDAKDLLVELSLPALATPCDEPRAVLRGSLRAFNVGLSTTQTVTAEARVARPKNTPADQPVNLELDMQLNRIRVAEAVEAASAAADAGRVSDGRAVLTAMRTQLEGTVSNEAPYVQALAAELTSIEQNYETAAQYRSVGSKMSKMSHYSHMRQRGIHTQSDDMYQAAKSRKMAMKSNWSMPQSSDDEE